jgi:hypothetical protein
MEGDTLPIKTTTRAHSTEKNEMQYHLLLSNVTYVYRSTNNDFFERTTHNIGNIAVAA